MKHRVPRRVPATEHGDLDKLALMKSVFEAVGEGIIVFDVDGRVLIFNQKFAEYWGIPGEIIAGSDCQSLIEHIARLLKKPADFRNEMRFSGEVPPRKEATTHKLLDGRSCEVSSGPQIIDGNLAGRILSFRDITVRQSAIEELNRKETFLTAIFENLTDSVVACDAEGNLTQFNRATSGLDENSSVPPPEDWAQSFELYNPDGTSLMRLDDIPLYRALHEGNVRDAEMVTRGPDGKMLTLITNGQAMIDKDQRKIGAVVVMHDITERKKAENALRENEGKLRNLLQSMSEGLLQVDAEERIVFANERFCEMSGYSREELLGKITLDLFFSADDRKVIKKANRQRRNGIGGHYEMDLLTKSGEMLHVIIGGTPMLDGEGNFTGTMGVFLDISERKRAEEQLLYDAFHDGLTGLANRTLFVEHLRLTIERGRRGKRNRFAVLFLDLDRFKVINDSLGHAAGDKLLAQIARRLESILRPGDLVARLGGDEFTVLLNELQGEADALRLAERIQDDLRLPFAIDGRDIFISASIGVSFGTPGTNADEMLRDADIAMYRAKAGGKARLQVFDKEMHRLAIVRLQMETELRHALDRGEFQLFYQPIVDIKTHELKGFEALIRWIHPERGMISPADFIPVAEESDLILGIGKWARIESCRQMRQWQMDCPKAMDLGISVNLSVKEFLQADLVEQIKATLEATGLNPLCLKLEITEGHVMEDSEMAVGMMDRLRRLGVQISLDDFGTGYSSLSYLHRLPVDFLKIDRSFIARMCESRENYEIVQTIIRLAQNLKMRIIAEGIETAEQLAQLEVLGCELGQGYFFSKPVAAEIARLFVEGSQWVSAPLPTVPVQNAERLM